MKKNLLILLFILPLFVHAQLTDNFSDGDFTNNPTWSGDASQFIVNASQQLQLQSSGTAVSSLSVASSLTSLDSTEWHFYIRMSFSPSSANYGRVYLVSDQSNLEGSLNGYYLQFGESLSNDAVELFSQAGLVSTSVCRGTNAQIANAFTLGVRVTRDATGLWNLFVDAAGGTNYTFEASGTNTAFNSSSFFGVLCSYTSSNATSFYFDDFFIGHLVPDVISPVISSLAVIDSLHLDVKFSEPIEQTSAETNINYSVNNGVGNPSTASRDVSDLSLVHLTFATAFTGNVQSVITISNVADVSSNVIQANSTAVFYYITQVPAPGDVVINEVLFHAQSGGSEFVELYNASTKVLDLKDIFLFDGLTNPLYTISATNRVFLPGDYMAITKSVANIEANYTVLYPNALVQVASMPTYTDATDSVMIATSSNQVLDRLNYSESWQLPLLNSTTGVSLERLNPARPTQDQSNWHSAAESAGFATPGYKNSEYDDSQGNGDEISIDPKIFSPDNDGHNDVVDVIYHFENPGNVANVSVYDAKGRLIRKLVNNELIGNDGSFVWDGITDSKDKARVGMYIFYIQVYDIKGDTKNYKKTCVLASKL